MDDVYFYLSRISESVEPVLWLREAKIMLSTKRYQKLLILLPEEAHEGLAL